jgi:hypothetical protein
MTALILDIVRTGREASDDEIRAIRADVAAVGFDPSAVSRAGLLAHGVRWAGRMIQSRDRLPVDVVHYLRHAVAQREWPSSTTFAAYLQSLRATIEDERSGIYLSRYEGVWSVAFPGRSGMWRGAWGTDWILVEYRPDYGFWVTGFQPWNGPEHLLGSGKRTDGRWLRQPS